MANYPNTIAASEDMYTSYNDAYAVTPSDSVNFNQGATRAIFVGGAGTLSVVLASGNTVSFTVGANAIGFVLPFRVARVNATGTTATLIVALY